MLVKAIFTGNARFDGVRFTENAVFEDARFTAGAWFRGAQFAKSVRFNGTQFAKGAMFGKAQFSELASFGRAQFTEGGWFDQALFAHDSAFGYARFANGASFGFAQFEGNARFEDAQFTGRAWFGRVRFAGSASFNMAQFTGSAWFEGVQFDKYAEFQLVQFARGAYFKEARFARSAMFSRTQFTEDAKFDGVRFAQGPLFEYARFTGDVSFNGATFGAAGVLGPLVCGGVVVLVDATFSERMTVQVAAAGLDCTHTRWLATSTVQARYAAVDVTDAFFGEPVAIIAYSAPFRTPSREKYWLPTTLDEEPLAGRASGVRVTSIRGVDAANLVLGNVDLSECAFSGAFHLDQLRLEGDISFARPPSGRRRKWLPVWWSRRRTLAEEHYWRTEHGGFGAGWAPAPDSASPVPGAWSLTGLYRSVRKALEDRGDAPGAADFYYGEMDMRRHDPGATSGERLLLTAYWLLAGYGLRASRALVSLLVAMTVTVVAMLLFGLPAKGPGPVTTGTPRANGEIVLRTDTPPAVLPPWGERITGERVGTAVPVVLKAVIFRSAETQLTVAGTYIDMAARLLEPSLLVLTVLAIRGRVKR